VNRILVITPERCIGCRTCELICSFTKIQEFNPKTSRVCVFSYDEAAISVPMMCMQCEEPSCMVVCPLSAISKTEQGVLIDEKKCIGCKMCVSACPLGNITFSTVERKIVKCNLCDGKPQCAEFCPSGAISFMETTPGNLNRKKAIAGKFKELFGEVEE
jgi:carbon-monoxide dehydrogenase iron sulfur subunit